MSQAHVNVESIAPLGDRNGGIRGGGIVARVEVSTPTPLGSGTPISGSSGSVGEGNTNSINNLRVNISRIEIDIVNKPLSDIARPDEEFDYGVVVEHVKSVVAEFGSRENADKMASLLMEPRNKFELRDEERIAGRNIYLEATIDPGLTESKRLPILFKIDSRVDSEGVLEVKDSDSVLSIKIYLYDFVRKHPL